MYTQQNVPHSMLQALMENNSNLVLKILRDQATFHLREKVNMYNVRICGNQNSYATLDSFQKLVCFV